MVFEKVYIIILNYNGYQDTIECLDSVVNSDYKNYQIIVVDNASEDNSMKYIKSWVKSNDIEQDLVIFIQSDANGGFASGNNIGIEYALKKNDFDYIWLLNNDTVIKNDSLNLLVEYAKTNITGITGSALHVYSTPNKVQTYGGYIDKFLGTGKSIRDKKDIDKLEYIVGASFLIDKKVIDTIGVLPSEYFLYYEDTDYCFNARNSGFNLGISFESIVYHKEGGSTGSSKSILKKSSFSDYHSFKSRKIFLKKYLPDTYRFIYLQFFIYLLHRLIHGKFKNMASLVKAMRED